MNLRACFKKKIKYILYENFSETQCLCGVSKRANNPEYCGSFGGADSKRKRGFYARSNSNSLRRRSLSADLHAFPRGSRRRFPGFWSLRYAGRQGSPTRATRILSSHLRAVPLPRFNNSRRMEYFCCSEMGKSEGWLVFFPCGIG